MKLIRKLLLAGSSLLAMSGAASADPVTIGGFLFTNTFLGGVAGLGTLITATQVAFLGLGLAAQVLLGGRQKSQAVDPGQFKSVFESSESSEINAIGRCSLAGLKVFGNTAGVNRHRMIVHSATELVVAEEFFLGERPVTVDSNGDVSSPPYSKPGGSWVSWQIKGDADGSETAWSTLTSAYPFWTSAHRARGLAQSLLTYISPGISTAKFNKLFQSGVPDPRITGRWCRVYDPRAGGASVDNEATWIWSMNGPLCAAHIMRTYPDLTSADFDWDFIAGEATKADVQVATRTGTEPRSTMSGVWLSESKRGDTMADVLKSIGAEITLSDSGLIRIRLIDDDPDAEIAFSDTHQLSNDWKGGPEGVERPNVCRIKYYSPERNYEMGEIDMTGIGWARIESEISHYGEKILDVDLPFCPSASQAQRIARRLFLLERADVGTMITNMTGMAAWGLTYASIELPDLDETPVCQIAPPRADDKSGEVEIPYKVWPQELIDTPWNPATMEAVAPDPIPDMSYVAELNTPGPPSAATVVQYADLSYETRVKFAAVSGGTVAEAVFRVYVGGEPNAYVGMTEYEGSGSNWFAYAPSNTIGDKTDFKCRFFNVDDEGSYFSDPLTNDPMAIDNTAPGAPDMTGTVDLDLVFKALELQVVRIVVGRSLNGSDWTTVSDMTDVRPDVVREVTVAGEAPPPYPGSTFVFWRVSSFTSNGTQGPFATGSKEFPADPP